jgi:cytochrome c oxidase subunit II
MWSKMRSGAWKYGALVAASLLGGGAAFAVPVPGGIDFQTPVTETAQRVHAFHTEVLFIITAIVVFVTALLLWVMIRYNKKANPSAKQFSHNTMIEIIWTVAPVLILVWIAKGSFPLLYDQDVMFGVKPVAELTAEERELRKEENVVDIKVYGNMWYWDYTYNQNTDQEFVIESRMLKEGDETRPLKPERGDIRQLSVDNPMVAPAGRYVRLKISAKDVIHSWAMPQFALKVDAVPGRLNQLWFKVDQPGIYYGQCSELCGKDHSNMPIELRILEWDQYNQWLAAAQADPIGGGRAYLDSLPRPSPTQVAAAQ